MGRFRVELRSQRRPGTHSPEEFPLTRAPRPSQPQETAKTPCPPRAPKLAGGNAPGCPPPPRRRGPSCPSAMLRRTWHLPFAQARLSQPWGRARAAFALAQRVAVSPPDGGLHRRQGGDYPQALRRPLTPHACQGFPPRAPQEHAAGKPVARHGGSDAAKGRAWAHRQPATRRG